MKTSRAVKKDTKERVMVKNTHLHAEHKLEAGENWTKSFAGKHIDLIPTTPSGKKACHKYHCQGFCWSDCKKADTHNQESMTPSVRADLTKWINKCRAEAN